MESDKYAKESGKKTAILVGVLIALIMFFAILSVVLTIRKSSVLIKGVTVEKHQLSN